MLNWFTIALLVWLAMMLTVMGYLELMYALEARNDNRRSTQDPEG